MLTGDIYFGDSKAAKRLRGCCSTANLSRHAAILLGILAVEDRSPLSLARFPAPPVSPAGANTSRADLKDRRTVPVVKELTGLGKQMRVLAVTVQRWWM